MKVYVQQPGESPRVISDTYAELPTVPNTGISSFQTRTTFETVDPGTVAFVKEFQMEFIFNGVSWSVYSNEIVGLASTSKPSNPPNGAKFREADTGILYLAYGGTWYPQP